MLTMWNETNSSCNATEESAVSVNASVSSGSDSVFESGLIVPLYVVIFVLAIVGNSLVLITLAQNKRMRTVTNVYLLNLAVSDMLLGVFCMPFTLVGQVLRNFVFGATMCRLIPYFQAVSVSVGVWTLVAISLERYFAICRPLKSRSWQTQFHAYKMIAVVWLASLLWNSPILLVSRLQAMKEKGRHKCREDWPSPPSERAYNIFLDAMLLLVPLVIMTLAYSLIVSKLWKGLRREIRHNTSCRRQQQITASSGTFNEVVTTTNPVNGKTSTRKPAITPFGQHRFERDRKQQQELIPKQPSVAARNFRAREENRRTSASVKLWLIKGKVQVHLPKTSKRLRERGDNQTTENTIPITQSATSSAGSGEDAGEVEDIHTPSNAYTFTRHAIRSNYMDKSIEAKKKVIRMLFVVVGEFFVCWAPIHVLNTWYIFSPESVYRYVGSTGVSLVQLLAYISSCCNPITYCFMNRKFRQAFLGVFDCYRCLSIYCCCCCRDKVLRNTAEGIQGGGVLAGVNVSDVSGNDSTVFAGRASTVGRSEVVVLEAEDRV